MNHAEPPDAAHRAPSVRLARLSRASLRITETLDLDTVLQGVVDGACSLTGARHGGITALDDAGQVQAFVTAGLTSAEHRLVVELPGGLEFFAYLNQRAEPLRVADFAAYIHAAGLPAIDPPLGPVGAFLMVPIRHLGRRVGNIYLAGPAGDARFSAEDEGTLMLFAAQAALAIANAQRYRAEQQARADLETLIDTSPVGVVVFDAASGRVASINREALRIVAGLRTPDQPAEQLLEILTFRRADGRAVSLAEYPLTQVLTSAETVRAEEIVIEVPDGRRVNTLINATPILAPEGGVASVVVTMQDLTPIKEAGRQRAEFLGLVGQELLAPLTSITGAAATALADVARLDTTKAQQFFRIIDWQATRMQGLIWDLLEVARIEAGLLFLAPEPTALASLVDEARAAFRASDAAHPVVVDVPPDLPPVAADRPRVLQVLAQLLANAAGASPEGAEISLSARVEDTHVAVGVADQGRGIPSQPLPLLFRRLARPAGAAGGRGTDGDALGLAVCRGIVEAHGGRIWAETDGPGLGARFHFTLPVADDAAPRAAEPMDRAAAGGRRPGGGLGRVLVVADDPPALAQLRTILSEAGYTPLVSLDPADVERRIEAERPHLVLLSLMLSMRDGGELLPRIVTLTDAPVVVLVDSGATQDRDVALALEAGADDYLRTPFAPTEVVARVGAALRRRDAPARALSREPFQLKDLAIDVARRRVTLRGQPVPLTDTEYRLLAELARHAGQVLSRDHLLRRVWSVREPADSGVLRAYVLRLRRKLGETAANPTYLFNEPRVGYRLGDPAEVDEAPL